jgi:ribonuclease HI
MAPGANPNSFRSEAYGVLATMRWYLHAFQVLQLPGHHSIDHYLDNQSVITRINQSLNSKIAFPNQRLLPEQDVIDEIVATIRKLPTATTIAWVKGHQDATQNYHQLTLSAQLNCEADELATAFTTSGDYHSPTVIPLPHTPASLLLHNNSVTGHIKFRVREAASTPPLHRYLCHRFRWDEEVIQMIDWKIYSYILPKYQKTRTTLVKHLHRRPGKPPKISHR